MVSAAAADARLRRVAGLVAAQRWLQFGQRNFDVNNLDFLLFVSCGRLVFGVVVVVVVVSISLLLLLLMAGSGRVVGANRRDRQQEEHAEGARGRQRDQCSALSLLVCRVT